MTAIFFSLATFFSTFAGGMFALKLNDRLHYILSFTAGVLLGVVSFDILPEIFELAHEHHVEPTGAMVALVGGFLFFHSVQKLVFVRHSHGDDGANQRHPKLGVFAALALAGHSFMDGVGIGLAFQVSPNVGVVVALAVIAHDFCDGLNTVSLMLVNHNSPSRAFRMLTLDAAAPMLGALSTMAFNVPPVVLMYFLGFFAGFLLYISASDILPEAHLKAPPARVLRLLGLTFLGAAFIFVAVRYAG
ncbi:MAG: ZIP family metal transporter [Micavibrio sp.]|nr:ZIP family metal transporter [Micavibrio sp.]